MIVASHGNGNNPVRGQEEEHVQVSRPNEIEPIHSATLAIFVGIKSILLGMNMNMLTIFCDVFIKIMSLDAQL